MIARVSAERDRIDEQARDLAATRDRLDAVIAAARGATGPCAGA